MPVKGNLKETRFNGWHVWETWGYFYSRPLVRVLTHSRFSCRDTYKRILFRFGKSGKPSFHHFSKQGLAFIPQSRRPWGFWLCMRPLKYLTDHYKRAIVLLRSCRVKSVECECGKATGCGAVGSAPALGAGGPRFKSAHPDHSPPIYLSYYVSKSINPISGSNSVVEFLPSKQAVAGSSPVSRSQSHRKPVLERFHRKRAVMAVEAMCLTSASVSTCLAKP